MITSIRPALFRDKQDGSDYINNTPATVLRITPDQTTKLDPYSVPELRVRGTGKTESGLTDDLAELRKAILSKYNGCTAWELPTSQWYSQWNDAFQRGISLYGPNNDACYLWTANQTLSSQTPLFCNLS